MSGRARVTTFDGSSSSSSDNSSSSSSSDSDVEEANQGAPASAGQKHGVAASRHPSGAPAPASPPSTRFAGTGPLGVLDSVKKIQKSVRVEWLKQILKRCQAEIKQEMEARAVGMLLNYPGAAPGPAAGAAAALAVASPGRAAGTQAGAAGPATGVQPAAKKLDRAAARMEEPEQEGSNKRVRVQEGVEWDAGRERAAARPAELARATEPAHGLRVPEVQRRRSSADDFAAAELAAFLPKSSAKDLDENHLDKWHRWTPEEDVELLELCDQATAANMKPSFEQFAMKYWIRLDKVERRAKLLLQARLDAVVAGQMGVGGQPEGGKEKKKKEQRKDEGGVKEKKKSKDEGGKKEKKKSKDEDLVKEKKKGKEEGEGEEKQKKKKRKEEEGGEKEKKKDEEAGEVKEKKKKKAKDEGEGEKEKKQESKEEGGKKEKKKRKDEDGGKEKKSKDDGEEPCMLSYEQYVRAFQKSRMQG